MIKIEKQENVNVITVTNNVGFEVKLVDLGASIWTIYYNGEPMTYGPKELADFIKPNFYYGKTIGRYAGRIPNAKFAGVDKVPNEGRNLLHSGNGVHNRVFKTRVAEYKNFDKVFFSLIETEKQNGFPGKFNLKVTYKIYKNAPKMELSFKSVCSKDCPVNLTNHAYFGLATDNLYETKLCIKAGRYVHVDEELLPISLDNVNKTFDFRRLRNMKSTIDRREIVNTRAHGYDHLFVFDNVSAKKPNIIMKTPKYTMKINTDFEATQIYSNCWTADFVNLQGKPDYRYACAAIEPQLNTYDMNHTILKAGVVRKNKIVYSFKKN